MEKDKIGAVLRNRIKERGYTQEQFAEETGIGLSSLKKYMNGTIAYNYEVLDLLATKLECSYDYLLGKSTSPQREFHEITEQTHLSEEAITNITKRAKYYESDLEAKRYLIVLDKLLCEEVTLESICDFLIATKPMNALMKWYGDVLQAAVNNSPSVKKLGIEKAKQISLETQEVIDVVVHLKNLKEELSPEFTKLMSEFDVVEKSNSGIEILQELFGRLGS